MSMPPTKPTLPVFDAIAASTTTRNEPSCSLNTNERTFGRSTTASMMAKRDVGRALATFSSDGAWAKPTLSTGSAPHEAMRVMACSHGVLLVTWNSRNRPEERYEGEGGYGTGRIG